MSSDAGAGKVAAGLSAGAPQDYAAFKVEQHGIDLIPVAERTINDCNIDSGDVTFPGELFKAFGYMKRVPSLSR